MYDTMYNELNKKTAALDVMKNYSELASKSTKI